VRAGWLFWAAASMKLRSRQAGARDRHDPVDSSVWVDHFQGADEVVSQLPGAGRVLVHPFVIGEVALGKLRQRAAILGYLRDLRQARVATDPELFAFIEQREVVGIGIDYVDAHLLASTRLIPGASLWTRDQRLLRVAEQLGLASGR
jgi:predicted nucleic acid-binding protein